MKKIANLLTCACLAACSSGVGSTSISRIVDDTPVQRCSVSQRDLAAHSEWVAGHPDGRRLDLQWCDLEGLKLRGADLRSAKMRGAKLRWSDLRDVDLRSADLRDANLEGADLRGARLWGTSLRDATLVGSRLSPGSINESNFR